MDKETIIRKIKLLLGAPSIAVELKYEQFEEAYETALEDYDLFSNSAPEKNFTSKLKEIWIKKYTLAVCKEMLGRVREKIAMVNAPGCSTTLDYKELLKESKEEKKFLFRVRLNNSPEGFILLNNKNA